jgi:hypothetical protein
MSKFFQGVKMAGKLLIIAFALASFFLLINGGVMIYAQAPAPKQITKDEVYFSIGRRINSVSESPVSAVVAEVDGVIEVTSIVAEPDGKAVVTVKERAPSSAAYTNKSTRLRFAPPPSGNQWTWIEFEENRKFYPVDKLFPYTKDELGKRRQLALTKWQAFVATIGKQGEAAGKALETARAVTKADLTQMSALMNIKGNLNQAVKDSDKDGLIGVYHELTQLSEQVLALGDTYSDLKANDAYLRLIDDYKANITATNAARKDYVQTVLSYNESLLRLPFCLVAYGLQFTKIEPNISAE